MLEKMEDIVFKEKDCCKVMACIPSARASMIEWVQHRGYDIVGSIAYPFGSLGHVRREEEVELLRFLKSRNGVRVAPSVEKDANDSATSTTEDEEKFQSVD